MEKSTLIKVGIFILLIGLYMKSIISFKPSEKKARLVIEKYLELAKKYSAYYPVIPASIILAEICKESSPDVNVAAIGDITFINKAYGLMQIRKPALQDFNNTFHKNYTEDDLKDAEKNIEVGTGYLSILYYRFDHTLESAIEAFNAGKPFLNQESSYYLDVMSYNQLIEGIITNG